MEPRNRTDWVFLLARFDGRISRRQFWAGLGTVAAAGAACAGLALMAAAMAPAPLAGGLVRGAAALGGVLLFPLAALATKRWHDRNKSGCRSLVVLIPVAGLIYLVHELGFVPGMSERLRPRLPAKAPAPLPAGIPTRFA